MKKVREGFRRPTPTTCVIASLGLILLTAFHCSAGNVKDGQGFFWSVRSDSATVYLYGSVHVGKPDFYPLPDAVESTFAAADKLAVEADVRPASQMTALPTYLNAAMLPRDTTLREQLPDNLRKLLDEYLKNADPAVSMMMHRMRPWAAAVTMMFLEMQASGFDAQWGVDLYFLNKADATGKDIIELESIEEQLTIFATLDPTIQQRMLKHVLQERDDIAETAERLIQSWKAGDGEALEREFMQIYADDEIMAPLKKVLLTDRDESMTETIGAFLEGTETIFIVVGAAHLIGEEGIVARLARNPALTVLRK